MNKIKLENLIKVTERFYADGNNKSIISLLEETGYSNSNDNINIAIVISILLENQDAIKHWINWSENKRTDSGWFLKVEDKTYDVGYLKNGIIDKKQSYDSLIEACANFIKLEVNDILNQAH